MVIPVIAIVPLKNPFHFIVATTHFGTFLLRNITALFPFALSSLFPISGKWVASGFVDVA